MLDVFDNPYIEDLVRKLGKLDQEKVWRERMRAEQRCVGCGEPNDRYPKTRCSSCNEVAIGNAKALQQTHRAQGLCIQCGDRWGGVEIRCAGCRTRNQVRRNVSKEKKRDQA